MAVSGAANTHLNGADPEREVTIFIIEAKIKGEMDGEDCDRK